MDLLIAYDRLRAGGSDSCLIIVGSGELEDELRQYIAGHRVPDVHFLGFRNQSELPEYYRLADVFVLPSENEPWGLIINEVMAAGLPVVAAEEIGAVADLVRHGDNGLTYPAGDVDALAGHLATLAANQSLRVQMARRSRQIVGDWDFELCVRGVRQALGFATAGRRRTTSGNPRRSPARSGK
jgi:glycosyltransferase involved in cell wall biosynthesis